MNVKEWKDKDKIASKQGLVGCSFESAATLSHVAVPFQA